MFGWDEYGDHGKWKNKNGEKNMTFHCLVGEGGEEMTSGQRPVHLPRRPQTSRRIHGGLETIPTS